MWIVDGVFAIEKINDHKLHKFSRIFTNNKMWIVDGVFVIEKINDHKLHKFSRIIKCELRLTFLFLKK